MRWSFAVVVVWFLLLGFAPAAGAAPSVPRGWVGVNADGLVTDDPAGQAAEWRAMRSAGVRMVRVAFRWVSLQPHPDTVDLSATDAVVLRAARNGMSVLAIVHSSPPWAATHPVHSSAPRNPQDYAAFLRILIARYGRSGSLWKQHPQIKARPIRNWQIWNEPNIGFYWYEQPFAAGYVELLRAAYKVIHAADRGATVVAAGLPNRSWEDLRKIYEAGGAGTFDAIAIHPFTKRVPDVLRIVRYVRAVQRRYKDARRPVWLTEMCWPASKPRGGQPFEGEPFETDNRGQAAKVARALRELAAKRRAWRIERVFWYTWHSWEDASIPGYWPSFCGLRRHNVHGKLISTPALRAFRRTISALTR